MSVEDRRIIYFFLALGSLYLVLLAFTNLWLGFVILAVAPGQGLLRIFASALGFARFLSAWTTILLLPVTSLKSRILLLSGILSGFVALVMVVVLEGGISYPTWNGWTTLFQAYALGGPIIVGFGLVAELLTSPNKSLNSDAGKAGAG